MAVNNTKMKILKRPVSAERAPASPIRMSSVPPKEVYDAYISRTIDGLTEFEIFDYAKANKVNVLIEGPTGPGKTMAARAYAAREGLHFYAVPNNVGVEPSQLFGKYIPNEDALDESDPKFIWQDGPVTDIGRHGGVLLLNEVNFMPPRVATVLFGLLDGRREITLLDHKGEVIQASDDLLIIADMNPDYEGTIGLNKAFRNRFAIQLDWDYDPAVEIKLVAGLTLRSIADNIRREHRAGNIDTPVSTNMLMEFEELARSLGIPFAVANFINHFGTEERASIKQVFDAVVDNLRTDYKTASSTKPKTRVDDGAVDDFDWSDVVQDTDYEWARQK